LARRGPGARQLVADTGNLAQLSLRAVAKRAGITAPSIAGPPPGHGRYADGSGTADLPHSLGRD